jgi:putative lipoic acid-binding regulatory protein
MAMTFERVASQAEMPGTRVSLVASVCALLAGFCLFGVRSGYEQQLTVGHWSHVHLHQPNLLQKSPQITVGYRHNAMLQSGERRRVEVVGRAPAAPLQTAISIAATGHKDGVTTAATASVAAAFLLGLAALAKILYAKCSGKLSVMEPLRMVSTAGQGFGQDPKKKEELVPDPCKDVDEVLIEYPDQREFVSIGSGDSYVADIVAAVEGVIGTKMAKEKIHSRPSSSGKYISVRVGPVWVQSEEEVFAIYSVMRQDPRTRYCI